MPKAGGKRGKKKKREREREGASLSKERKTL